MFTRKGLAGFGEREMLGLPQNGALAAPMVRKIFRCS